MSGETKQFFLRIGSNNERNYVVKAGPLFSGLLVRANYFESAPGLLSGIFLKFSSLTPVRPFVIDPVTYVYALDPKNDWSIRSWQKVKKTDAEQKLRKCLKLKENEGIPPDSIREIEVKSEKDKNKVEILGIKRAYRKLGDLYFDDTLAREIGKRALVPNDFTATEIKNFVRRVIEYQNNVVISNYDSSKFDEFKSVIPKPAVIICPYFCFDNEEWYKLNKALWESFDTQYTQVNGGIVIQSTIDYIKSNTGILNDLAKVKAKNIFLWLDNFVEEEASEEDLRAYVNFVVTLAKTEKNVFNLYAGGFSPFLLPFGLFGIVNNAGYGMQRDIEPLIGGVPTAQYYIPSLHVRTQILSAFQLMTQNNAGRTKEDFLRDICSCPVCKEGIKKGIEDFVLFFWQVAPPKNKPDSNIKYPSQECLQRCAFHFILSRLIEYRFFKQTTRKDALTRLSKEIELWKGDNVHLKRWKKMLEEFLNT